MRTLLAACAAVALLTGALVAQTNESAPYARLEPLGYRSPTFANDWTSIRPVDHRLVRSPGASSLRLFFEEVDVRGRSFLVATSLRDGQSHVLTPRELAKWGSTTGSFNGDTVSLELWLAPGERGSYAIDRLLVGFSTVQHTSICGTDDRVPSNDNRSVRMLNGSGTSACSGWLVSTDDCVFSAGHCMPTYASVAEVNVPPSTSSGALVHPPIQDQFPVDQGSLSFVNGGVGNDWGVGKLFTNNMGQSASALHGHFQLGLFFPTPGDTIRITGYGSDSGTTNQTHQTHTGPYHSSSGNTVRYAVDTTGGNSGSVVIHEATGLAVGIHTHGGCSSSGGYNSGTSVTLPALQNAFAQNCSQGGPPEAGFSVAAAVKAPGVPVHFLDASTSAPTTWIWDFDEDGLTDSTAQDPSFAYASTGTYDVTLTTTNSFGSDTVTVEDAVTVVQVNPVTPPYAQTFTNGLPEDGSWTYSGSNGFGSITAGQNGGGSPQSGADGLVMASTQSATDATNDATLHFGLDPNGAATLQFQFKEFGDENDPEDGVFLSDGVTEVLLQSFNDGPAVWTLYTIDVGAAVAQNGLNPGALRLVFRQRDNYPVPTDGVAIDDVALLGQAGPCASPITYGTGEVGSTGATAAIGWAGGAPKAGNTGFAVTVTGGPPLAFAVVFSGSAQAMSPTSWGTILVGGAPFTRTFLTLDATGDGALLLPIVAPLVGQTRAFQYAIRDPGFGGSVQASDGLLITFCP